MKNKYLCVFLISILSLSCGREERVETKELRGLFYNLTCTSRNNLYTECTTLSDVSEILHIIPRRPEDCVKGVDYYLLDSRTLVVNNNCSANFILRLKVD